MWIPNLVGADYMPERSTQDATAYRAGIIDFYNGVGPEDGEYYYSSAEMRELSKVRFDTQMMIDNEKIRAEFPGSRSTTWMNALSRFDRKPSVYPFQKSVTVEDNLYD